MDEADQIYRDVLRDSPLHPVALHLSGLIAHKKGDVDFAIEQIKKAIEVNPKYFEAYANLASVYKSVNQPGEAINCFEQALTINPESAEMHYELALTLKHVERNEAAISHYQAAIEIRPAYFEALINLGNIYREITKFEEAEQCYRDALAIQPDSQEVVAVLEQVSLKSNGNLVALTSDLLGPVVPPSRSIASDFDKNLTIDLGANGAGDEPEPEPEPDYSQTYLGLGLFLQTRSRTDEAISIYKELVSRQKDEMERRAEAHRLLSEYPHLPEADVWFYEASLSSSVFLDAYGTAIQTDAGKVRNIEGMPNVYGSMSEGPDFMDANINLGKGLLFFRDLDYAIETLEYAVELGPTSERAHWYLAMALLHNGDLERGFAEYEWGLKAVRVSNQQVPIPYWDGEPLTGKTIVVLAEQGIGDQLCFAGCLPDLLQLAPKSVVLECETRLVPLFSRSFPEVDVKARSPETFEALVNERSNYDFSVAVGSLSKYFRKSIDDYPDQAGYLIADSGRVNEWSEKLAKLGSGLNIGISWRGGHTQEVIDAVSIWLPKWEPILQQEPAFVNLQYGSIVEDLASLDERLKNKFHHFSEYDALKNLDDQAALISALDLVITIDNATLHMGGAVGTPTWGLLSAEPDWRWAKKFGNYPKVYPSLRVFRQQPGDGWEGVVGEVSEALHALISQQNNAD